jgi:hypothetical protein
VANSSLVSSVTSRPNRLLGLQCDVLHQYGIYPVLGSDFYWALGLAIVIVLEITILGVMFVKDKQKRQIYTPGEAIELSTTVNEDDGEYKGGEDDNDDPFHDGMQELSNITTTTTTTIMLEVKTGEEELVDSNLPRIV